MFRWSIVGLLSLILVASTLVIGKNGLPKETPAMPDSNEEPRGLIMDITSSQPGGSVRPSAARADGEPLDGPAMEAVLSRLPSFASPPEEKAFSMRPTTLPPPKTGGRIEKGFEEPVTGPAVPLPDDTPLEVLRFAPEGPVDLAPLISVTFSKSMVPLTTHEVLSEHPLPLIIRPELPWDAQWLGTQTLAVKSKTRLPMATSFSVEVPAGTTAIDGTALQDAVSWQFSTPAPKLIRFYPTGSSEPLNPLMFLAFDQDIDPELGLHEITAQAGKKSVALRLVPQSEWRADAMVKRLIEAAQDRRWLVLRPVSALPKGAQVTVSVNPGFPSAEGPLTTQDPQRFSFSTYGALEIVEHRCGWRDVCRPGDAWTIRFSNSLDAERFEESWVHTTPQLSTMRVSVHGASITIVPQSKGQTTYTVTLSKHIQDVFGQTLENDQTVTFKVGSAEPRLYADQARFRVMDPAGGHRIPIHTINYETLRVRIFRVKPDDWRQYLQLNRGRSWEQKQLALPGEQLVDKDLAIACEPDSWVETSLDLTSLAGTFSGHAIVFVEGGKTTPRAPKPQRRYGQGDHLLTWVQRTSLGLSAFADGDRLTVWANSLLDGQPRPNVAVSLVAMDSNAVIAEGRTDARGLVDLALTHDAKGRRYLVARWDDDFAFLPENLYGVRGSSQWAKQFKSDAILHTVVVDRDMVRPGEAVHLKGFLRIAPADSKAQLVPPNPDDAALRAEVIESRGNRIHVEQLRLSPLGGFDFSFTVPEDVNLGHARIVFQLSNGDGSNQANFTEAFQIQEFRRPEFEVSVTCDEGPHMVGGSADLEVTAAYYSGGGLPDAPVQWILTTTPGSYRPPGWDGFTFGTWVPWWRWDPHQGAESSRTLFEGTTDEAGKHGIHLGFRESNPPRAHVVHAQADVADVNRQTWTGRTRVLVHPAAAYVGLRSDRIFVEQGKPLVVDAIVTDLEGNALPNTLIEVRAYRTDWAYRNGEWQETEKDEKRLTVKSAQEPVAFKIETGAGGAYHIEARVVDDRDRPNQSSLTRWVSGGTTKREDKLTQESVMLIPDKQEYRVGQVAHILVQSPFVPAFGVWSVRQDGLRVQKAFDMKEGSITLDVPITQDLIPNAQLQVDLVGQAPRLNPDGETDPRLPPRPAYAVGTLNLSVPPYTKTLHVGIDPDRRGLQPGDETNVRLTVTNAEGEPFAGAEVAVAIVDEAILALTNYTWPDPLDVFYPRKSPGVTDTHLRQYVLLADPDLLDQAGAALNEELQFDSIATEGMERQMMSPAPMAAKAAAPRSRNGGSQPIRMRSDFDPLVLFEPTAITDDAGLITLQVKMKDSLTRYRIMVMAVSDGVFFGRNDASLVVRLPLMLRPSPPRFLNFGDKAELPLVIQNQTEDDLEVDVVLQCDLLREGLPAGRRLTIPAQHRREVRFPVAADKTGRAKFQAGVRCAEFADAAQFDLPILTPCTTEAFATYATLENDVTSYSVAAPSNVFDAFGGLTLSASSTQLQELTDAFIYLQTYPFECVEQIASRLLGVIALKDVLRAFDVDDLPTPEACTEKIHRDFERLGQLQNEDGGFDFWVRGRPSWPYVTIHATHAMVRARRADVDVPDAMLDRALEYLRHIDTHLSQYKSERVKDTLRAYALYVRTLSGEDVSKEALAFCRTRELNEFPLEVLGWMLSCLDTGSSAVDMRDHIIRYVTNRVSETAGTAQFTTQTHDGDHLILYSQRKVDAIVLEGLLHVNPDHDLIPKLVRGLLAHRVKGRWNSTQENAFVLLALNRYFQDYEGKTPNFVARFWLDSGFIMDHGFQGRSTDTIETQIPMSYLAQTSDSRILTVQSEGKGRLYLRMGLRYAPHDLDLEALDRGFTVERTYEAMEHPSDVTRDEDGVWHVVSGAPVRVTLTLVAPARRHHVALVDPMPAGFESLNPSLAVSGPVIDQVQKAPSKRPWYRYWFDHQNLKDDRAEVFSALVWPGVYTYSYVARATTPGTFVVPPTKAEEMYAPETFGRGTTMRVIVADP